MFLKSGMQRKFLEVVLERLMCPSLRSLKERGIKISYSCLKNYFNEYRTLPKELFEDLCILGKIDKSKLKFKELGENWGQCIGGKA